MRVTTGMYTVSSSALRLESLKDTREKESDTKESDTFDERDIVITLL